MTVNVQNAVLQSIVTNLGPITRQDRMEGREYLVVPMVMLTEGVHRGSNGPLYYPADELSKTPVVWNHKPIVVYHPTMMGQAISACDPDVITSRKVGVIMNAVFKDGKLKAEAWLETDRLQSVDDRVITAIENKQAMEVSTGLFTDNEEVEGEWKGKKYTSIARNYRPDHLALLPDQKGACSIEDGAGLLQNRAGLPEGLTTAETVMLNAYRLATNEMSQDDLRTQLNGLLPKAPINEPMAIAEQCWVSDVFETYFVYSSGSRQFKQDYLRTGDDIQLVGLPVEVVRATQYKTLDGTVIGNQTEIKGKVNHMDPEKKAEVVGEIIASPDNKLKEEDKSALEKLPDTTLEKLAPTANQEPAPGEAETEEEKKKRLEEEAKAKAEEEAKKLKGNQEEPVLEETDEQKRLRLIEEEKKRVAAAAAVPAGTVNEYIANAPEGMREVLQEGVDAHRAHKARLVQAIMTNKANTFTQEQLEAKSTHDLRSIASLATSGKPVASFAGQGELDPTANVEEPLGTPSTA